MLAPGRNYDLRASLLSLVWAQVPTGNKIGQFTNSPPEPCPLCGEPDSLEHVILRCPGVDSLRRDFKFELSQMYIPDQDPKRKPLGTDLPEIVRKCMRKYIKMALSYEAPELPDTSILAIWLARPQQSTLCQWDQGVSYPSLVAKEQQHLFKELVRTSARLLESARRLWRARCSQAFDPMTPTPHSAISVTSESPILTQSTIEDFFPSMSASSPPKALATGFHLSASGPLPSPDSSPLVAEPRSQDVAPSPPAAPKETPRGLPPRVNPTRFARPPQGSTIDLVLHSDSSVIGLLPEHLHASSRAQGDLHAQLRKTPDYIDTWVADSFCCPGGALGFFFGIPAGRTLPGGTLLGIYFGPDTAHPAGLPPSKRKVEYNSALARWSDYDNVLAYPPAQYVVRGDPRCGPARANDGFANTNSILTYSRLDKRMEVRTKAPMHGGPKGAVFESLVNYDIPHAPPSYWTVDRLAFLPPEARQQCLSLYSAPPPSARSLTARRPIKKKKKTPHRPP